MSIEAMGRQYDELDALNQALEGRFRVLKGFKANILSNRALDLKREEP